MVSDNLSFISYNVKGIQQTRKNNSLPNGFVFFIFILFYFIFLAFKDILLSISYDAGFIEKILDNFVNKFPISLLRLNNEEIALQLL